MAIKTLYTAVGRFERRTNGCNRSCPIILLGGQEYMADMQEMVIWSMLNWRILRWDDIAQEYEKLATASGYCTERSWEDCTNRLLTRGLLVSGSGETEYDALYDLLGSLSIIPTSGPFFLRLASFVKLTLLAHVPVSAARKLFQKDKRTKYEALVMRLAGQALLSTAEILIGQLYSQAIQFEHQHDLLLTHEIQKIHTALRLIQRQQRDLMSGFLQPAHRRIAYCLGWRICHLDSRFLFQFFQLVKESVIYLI